MRGRGRRRGKGRGKCVRERESVCVCMLIMIIMKLPHTQLTHSHTRTRTHIYIYTHPHSMEYTTCSAAHPAVNDQRNFMTLEDNGEVVFTYDVEWVEDLHTVWAHRWDVYLK